MMSILSMKIVGAAQIAVGHHRLRFARGGAGTVELVGDDRGDAFVGERPIGDGAGRHRLGAGWLEVLEQPEHAKAGPEPLFRVWPPGENGDDQPFGIGANGRAPAAEALRRPFGVAPVRARHMLGIGAMFGPAMTALMHGNPLALMKDLDDPRRRPGVDLVADQLMRHRVEKSADLDMIIQRDAGKAPFGEFVIRLGQRRQSRALDRLEQMPPAEPEPAHDMRVDPFDHAGDRLVGFGQGEERLMPQPAQNIALGETHAGLHLGLILRPPRPGRQNADAVMRGHPPVAAIDLGIVERCLVDAGLQIIRHDQARHPAEKPEHADMGANPIGQRLGPTRLAVGETRGAQDRDKNFRKPHRPRCRVGDAKLFTGIIDEDLVARPAAPGA